MPATFVEGQGLTLAKVLAEYVIIAMYVMAGMLLWQRSTSNHKHETLLLAVAALVMALSEVFLRFMP